MNSSSFRQFSLETLKLATSNFSDQNQLGKGGFGAVYKVKLIMCLYAYIVEFKS